MPGSVRKRAELSLIVVAVFPFFRPVFDDENTKLVWEMRKAVNEGVNDELVEEEGGETKWLLAKVIIRVLMVMMIAC